MDLTAKHKKIIGLNLYYYIHDLMGMTQEEFSSDIKYSLTTINNWVNGRTMKWSSLERIAAHLSRKLKVKIKPTDLLDEDFAINLESNLDKRTSESYIAPDISNLNIRYPSLVEFLTNNEYLDEYKPTEREAFILSDVYVNFQPTIRFWIGVLNEIRMIKYDETWGKDTGVA